MSPRKISIAIQVERNLDGRLQKMLDKCSVVLNGLRHTKLCALAVAAWHVYVGKRRQYTVKCARALSRSTGRLLQRALWSWREDVDEFQNAGSKAMAVWSGRVPRMLRRSICEWAFSEWIAQSVSGSVSVSVCGRVLRMLCCSACE